MAEMVRYRVVLELDVPAEEVQVMDAMDEDDLLDDLLSDEDVRVTERGAVGE